MRGLVLNSAGELFTKELSGPMDYDMWESCFMVFRCAAVMLGIALDIYKDHNKQYAACFTQSSWPLIYQADTRARRELSVRMARNFSHEKAALGDRAATHPYNPQMPWDHVFRSMPDEFAFWKGEVEDPGMLIITGAASGTPQVSGEAPVARRPQEHIFMEEPVNW